MGDRELWSEVPSTGLYELNVDSWINGNRQQPWHQIHTWTTDRHNNSPYLVSFHF
jgi:hypothetical protein